MTPDLLPDFEAKKKRDEEASRIRSEQIKQIEDAKKADTLYLTIQKVLGISVRCYPAKRPLIHWGREELYLDLEGSNIIAYWQPRVNFEGKNYEVGIIKSFFFDSPGQIANWIELVQKFIQKNREAIVCGKQLQHIESDNTRRGFRDP